MMKTMMMLQGSCSSASSPLLLLLLRCTNSPPKPSTSSNASIASTLFLLQKNLKVSAKSAPASAAFLCQSPHFPAVYRQPRRSKAALSSSQEGSDEVDGEEFPRESVSHVASSTAIETPQKVHEEAKEEVQSIASEKGRSTEEISKKLEADADEASQEEAEALEAAPPSEESHGAVGGVQEVLEASKGGIENSKAAVAAGKGKDGGYENAKEAVQPHVEAASEMVEGVKESGRNAGEVYGFMKEAFDKRVRGLSQATEEALDVGMKAVEMASKRWEDLLQQANEVHGYVAEQFKGNSIVYPSTNQEDRDPRDEDQTESSQKNRTKY